MARLESFARRLDSLCERHGEKRLGTLLGNEDVCRILRVSPRTLQTLRDNGTLAYCQIQHKIYYKPEDVQRIVAVVNDKKKGGAYK